jgi:hypothetical protein
MKLNILAFVFISFLFSACSKADDVKPEALLVGKWSLTGISANIDAKNVKATAAALKENELTNAVYEFKSDKTGVVDGEAVTYTYDAPSKSLVIVYDVDYKETYAVEVTSGTLKLTSIKAELEPKVQYTANSPETSVLLGFIFLFEDQEDEIVKLGIDDAKTIQLVFDFKK